MHKKETYLALLRLQKDLAEQVTRDRSKASRLWDRAEKAEVMLQELTAAIDAMEISA